MGNLYTTKSCISGNIFTLFECTNYNLYDVKNIFGTVMKCPKASGSTGEIITPQKVLFLAVNIFAVP
jgi:hypothetical protein